jgi:hypothetical protein
VNRSQWKSRFGAYEASIGVGQSALFAAPVGSNLGLGLHEAETGTTAQQPSVLVLPECCATIHDPEKGLCFAARAPRCLGPELEVRVGGRVPRPPPSTSASRLSIAPPYPHRVGRPGKISSAVLARGSDSRGVLRAESALRADSGWATQ